VLSTHKSETALSIRNKLERDIEFKDGKIKEIGEHIDKLNGAMALNPQVKRVEQENQELMRRCLNCEKEISMANAKIKEAQMLLEARAKEREQESLLKRELLHNIDLKKMEIDEARKMNELIIAQKVKEKEEADIREKNKEIKKVEDKIDQLKNRIALEEEGISTISQDKVTIQQDIIENEQIKETLEKDLGLARKKAHDLKIMYDFYSDREKTLSAKVEPLANATQKLQAIIPSYEQEIKHYEEQLAMFDKQVSSRLTSDRVQQTDQGPQLRRGQGLEQLQLQRQHFYS
jgi:chromosome segregation ATPase